MFGAESIVDKDFILKRVTEEEIFIRYLGLEPTLTGSFTNPLREDDHPGCGFYINPQGRWKFKDHAAGFDWDCFNVIEYDYGCSFKEALLKVASDFNLISGSSNRPLAKLTKMSKAKRVIELRIKRREWTKKDYAYWEQYHITPERLAFFKVSPVLMVWFLENGILRLAYAHNPNEIGYVYHFGNSYDYKIYIPQREKGKHIHVNSKILQGYDQLPKFGNNLALTKSYKDVMCVDIFHREYDLYSVAPVAETILISREAFEDLYNRFDYIATLFDLDRTGILLMRAYEKEYQLPHFFIGKEFRGTLFKKPLIKDFSDFVRYKGLDETRRLIERALKTKDEVPF